MENRSVFRGLLYGGVASCIAETITIPVDVVKTRLQMDGAGVKQAYTGTVNCAMSLVRSEGGTALFKGLPPALLRQSSYGSMRYGLYTPIRDALGVDATLPKSKTPLWKKIVAGGGAGAIASAIANPTDLVKVRMQTDGMLQGATGELLPKKYHGVRHCFLSIIREEGVLDLWRGIGPTMGRATVLAAAELSSYDEIKMQLRRHDVVRGDGLLLHTLTASAAGFISTVASSPFDVVKSRVMGQPVDASGRGLLYSGMIDCFAKLATREGPMSLYRGFWANFGRVVPRVVIVFVVMEQFKSIAG